MLRQLNKEERYGKVGLKEFSSIAKLNSIFEEISSKYGLSQESIIHLIKKKDNYISIPAAIFDNILSPLETLVMFLQEKFDYNQTEIAGLLNRDHTTIWTTISKARKKTKPDKFRSLLEDKKEKLLIPIKIFSDRTLSILESLSIYIKEEFDLSYREIGKILGKDERTIWTVVRRGRKKRT